MDGNKLELSTKPINGPPTVTATYKAIPETDLEEEAVTRPKSLVKAKTSIPQVDGADEKMLPKEEKVAGPNSNIDLADVKISSNEKQKNGDAKLDIGEVRAAFVGLTKEELMQYANDPFWVRLRWFLFITFWVLWAAMLGGAILIIYAAPKCDPPPPRTWWQQGPLTEVDHATDIDELKSLKDKGVQGFIVNWPEDAYDKFNTTYSIVTLIQRAKEEDINIIAELDPSTSEHWFRQSENRHPQLSDYYIWRREHSVNASGAPEPPNNWKTTRNDSSWIYSETRKEFYYAPTGKPLLNFRNPNVVDEFSKTISTILDFGARGIRLLNVPFLLTDPNFEDEAILPNTQGFFLTDYGFYAHTKTEHLLDLAPLLRQWRTIVKNKTENGPLMAADDLSKIEAYRINGSLVVDLPSESRIFTKSKVSAPEIVKAMTSIFAVDNITWPLWKYKTSGVLDIVTFLLPGVPLMRADAPINSDLLKIRSSASIMRGNFSYHSVANNTVFAFNRMASGNPGILVAYNPTDQHVTVDFPQEIPAVSEEVTIQLFSSNYSEPDIVVNVKRDAHSIPVSPNSAIVLSYVPKAA